jgi:hypothetical protein
MNIITMCDDEYDLDIEHAGPTMAFADGFIINHQTCYTEKLVPVTLDTNEEKKELEKLINQEVQIGLSVLGMFQYVDTWDELFDLDDEDWYVDATILAVKPGQIQIESEDETYWLPLKHIDVIEVGSSTEPYEYETQG